ncbi:hypothetical protein ACFSKL_14745 [Belliella marina]|uniref:Uncharacterized protein n=1 Tax=Belliella marina TaxID=1644146 RepID=A0ABW4VPE1_9BACT
MGSVQKVGGFLLLPQGLLEFFKVTKVALHDNSYYIYLEDLNIHPEHLQGVNIISKGFFKVASVGLKDDAFRIYLNELNIHPEHLQS